MTPAAAKTSPTKAVFAIAALLLGAYACWRGIAGTTPPIAVDHGGQPSDVEPATGDVGDAGEAGPRSALGDLLLRVGSYRPGTAVPVAFRAVEAAVPAPAAPGGESAVAPVPIADQPPPPMRVTFVMVGREVSRACVDGVVVGVGAAVKAGVVTAIAGDGVEVRAGRQSLFYDLTDPLPRGFRAPAGAATAADETRTEEHK